MYNPRQSYMYGLLDGNNNNKNYMISALVWVITQRIEVIAYRIFGTTYRSHLQNGTDSLSRNVGKELPIYVA